MNHLQTNKNELDKANYVKKKIEFKEQNFTKKLSYMILRFNKKK